MREPPSGPCEQDWIATGFSLNGWSFMRETPAIGFFRGAVIVQLYSGDTMITPSGARIAEARSSAAGGKPDASWISELYIGSPSYAGAEVSFIPSGVSSGSARARAALYEFFRNDPQITSTFNCSAV